MHFNSCKPNCLVTVKGINDTLVPRSHNAIENSILPMVQGVEKLPGSFNFGGSLYCMMALHLSINAIVTRSSNFLFRVMISLSNFAYEGIYKIVSTKEILICNYFKILTNFSNYLSSLFGLSHWGNRTAGGIEMVVEDEGWSSFDFSLLHSPTLTSCSTRSSLCFSLSLFPTFSITEGSSSRLPLQRVMVLTCSLRFTSVLLGNSLWLQLLIELAIWSIWTFTFLYILVNWSNRPSNRSNLSEVLLANFSTVISQTGLVFTCDCFGWNCEDS